MRTCSSTKLRATALRLAQRLRDSDARTGMEIAFVPLDGDGLSLVERLRATRRPRAALERRRLAGAIDDFIQGSLSEASSA